MCLLILNDASCQFHYGDNKSDRVVTFILQKGCVKSSWQAYWKAWTKKFCFSLLSHGLKMQPFHSPVKH